MLKWIEVVLWWVGLPLVVVGVIEAVSRFG